MEEIGIGITARAQKVEPDGRRLLVEALVRVAGLEDSDLKYIGEITLGDTRYRLLDPISMRPHQRSYRATTFQNAAMQPSGMVASEDTCEQLTAGSDHAARFRR